MVLSPSTVTGPKPTLEAGKTYRFPVTVKDQEGNRSELLEAMVELPSKHPLSDQGSTCYTSIRGTMSLSSASEGNLSYKSASADSAKLTLDAGVLNACWAVPKQTNPRMVEAWVSRAKAKDVDLYSSSTQSCRVVCTKNNLSTLRAKAIEAYVLGHKHILVGRADVGVFFGLQQAAVRLEACGADKQAVWR